jgi:tetratricopeptide (TPR) repeat protein
VGEANVLKAIGDVKQFRDDRDGALTSYAEALRLFREVGTKLGEAVTLRRQGHVYLSQEIIDQAEACYRQSLLLARETGDSLSEAYTVRALGDVAKHANKQTEAKDLFETALQLFRKVDAKLGEANSLVSLGELALELSEPAQQFAKDALAIYQHIGEATGEGEACTLLGRINQDTTWFEQAIAIHTRIQNNEGLAEALEHFGVLLCSTGEKERGQARLSEAEQLWLTMGLPRRAEKTREKMLSA